MKGIMIVLVSLLCCFVFSMYAFGSEEMDKSIVVLDGSLNEHRAKYTDVTNKVLDRSDLAILFLQSGNVLLAENKKGCNVDYDPGTLRVSSDGKRFTACLTCNDKASTGCVAYSPATKESIPLGRLERPLSYSPNGRFIAFQDTCICYVRVVDLISGKSLRIAHSGLQGISILEKVEAYDDGRVMIKKRDFDPVYYDFEGKIISE